MYWFNWIIRIHDDFELSQSQRIIHFLFILVILVSQSKFIRNPFESQYPGVFSGVLLPEESKQRSTRAGVRPVERNPKP